MSSFFVDTSKGTVQPPSVAGWDAEVPTQPRMGRVERTCDRCGREWGPTRCSDPICSSIEFTDRVIQPIPVMTRLAELVRPKKKLHATPSQVKALRGLQTAATALLVELRVVDEQLREAVRDNDVQELRGAQATVNLALSITGDASPDRTAHLSLALVAFAASLSREIGNLEANPK